MAVGHSSGCGSGSGLGGGHRSGGIGFGQVVATGIAASVVGLFATVISVSQRAPALVTATAGITPLLPGLAVFQAVFAFAVDKRFGDGLAQMLAAGATALAIGSGVVMGEFLGSPLRRSAGRIGRFLQQPEQPGIRRAVGRGVELRPVRGTPTHGGDYRHSRSIALEPVDDTALS